MNVAIGSAFRNSAGEQVTTYLNQVAGLAHHLKPYSTLRVIAVEGDSADDTRAALASGAVARRLDLDLRTHNHGQRWFGSTEEGDRLAALSGVANEVFAGVRETDDALIYVESDLLWDPFTITSLMDAAVHRRDGFDVVSPLVFAGSRFYDIWGFRKDGDRFSPLPPYHAGLDGGITEIDSAGSCLVMRGEVARVVRVEDGRALIGWCAAARARQFRLGVMAELRIQHPL